MGPSSLSIGEAAARAGVHRETLRYYERRELIAPPPRRASGYRAYPPETVERVRLIKWAQGLGFSLRDFGADPALFVRVAEWITLERRCCAFLDFGLDWLGAETMRLRLTGGPGVKAFLEAALGVDQPSGILR